MISFWKETDQRDRSESVLFLSNNWGIASVSEIISGMLLEKMLRRTGKITEINQFKKTPNIFVQFYNGV